MNPHLLWIWTTVLAASVHAATPQVFDLGNGAEIVVKAGQVEVRDRPGTRSSSANNNVSTQSIGNGTTLATVTSERDGRREIRTLIISSDGRVTMNQLVGPPVVVPRAGGWLGVHSIEVDDTLRSQVTIPGGQGIVLNFVSPDGPAARVGLIAHDILLTLDGKAITSVENFRSLLAQTAPEQKLHVTYLRKGEPRTATVTLGTPPAATPDTETPAKRMLRDAQERSQATTSSQTIIVNSDGKVEIKETGHQDAFEALLKDPSVPDSIKQQIRQVRDSMRQASPPQSLGRQKE